MDEPFNVLRQRRLTYSQGERYVWTTGNDLYVRSLEPQKTLGLRLVDWRGPRELTDLPSPLENPHI